MRDSVDLDAAVIPPVIVLNMIDLADRRGVYVDQWFSGTGHSTETLSQTDAKLSFRQASLILQRGLRALPPEPVGLQLGTTDFLVSWGMLGVAMRACDTVGEAVDLGVRFNQASGSLVDAEYHLSGDEFAIELTERAPVPDLRPLLAEEAFAATVALGRVMMGEQFCPSRIEFAYPRPAYVATYDQFFRCPLIFGAEATRLLAPADVLSRPVPTRNPSQLSLALDATRRLLDPADRRPAIVATVESVLRRNLGENLTMVDVADRLCITERTLHRKLAAAGHKFSEIRDNVRHRRALILLRESDIPIGSVAHAVGYSDAREFRRAFYRWTGHSPTQERATASTA